MSWHLEPFTGWDTETTSADPEECRLVTSTVVTVAGSLTKARDWLINPGVEIPKEAAEIHGVTTERARADGMDPAIACIEIRDSLYTAWDAGQPVVIYNAPFDCTVLDRELRRHHGDGLEIRGPIVDPFCIDKELDRYRKGKRTLTATCEHYNVRLDDAHSSGGDALAACRLAWRLAQVYAEQLGDLSRLNELQADWRETWAIKFEDYLRSQGKVEHIDGHWPMRPVAVPS